MTLTLETACKEFCVSKETLRRGLQSIGAPTEKGTKHDLSTIWRALSGDLKNAKARESLANAISKERENQIADGELIPLSDVQSWMDKVLLAIRQRLLALPSAQSSRCNPTDPTFAQQSLDQWVSETLPLLRNDIQATAK